MSHDRGVSDSAEPGSWAQTRRIMVYGVTGSGKSVAAERIAATSGLPLIRIDDLMWLPGWQPVAAEEQRRIVADVVAGDAWVLDHGYGRWLDLVLDRVDLVVALDFPRVVSLRRLILRSLNRVITRQPMCNGNVETWRRLLGPDSIIRWHWQSFVRKRRRIRDWAARQQPPTIRMRSPRQLDRWITRAGG